MNKSNSMCNNIHILKIQERTGAKVNFKDDAPADGDDRIVIVRGTHMSAQQAELEVKQIIAAQPPIVTDNIVVPDRSVGRIIGEIHEIQVPILFWYTM